MRDTGDVLGVAECLDELGMLLAQAGRPRTRQRRGGHGGADGADRHPASARATRGARRGRGARPVGAEPAAFARAWERGRLFSLDEAVRFALATADAAAAGTRALALVEQRRRVRHGRALHLREKGVRRARALGLDMMSRTAMPLARGRRRSGAVAAPRRPPAHHDHALLRAAATTASNAAANSGVCMWSAKPRTSRCARRRWGCRAGAASDRPAPAATVGRRPPVALDEGLAGEVRWRRDLGTVLTSTTLQRRGPAGGPRTPRATESSDRP